MDPMINVGQLRITTQAFVIAALGLVAAIVVFLKTKRLAFAIPVALGAIWQSYTVNCAVVGRCDTFAWVLVAMYFLGFLMVTTAPVKKLFKK